MSAKNAIGDIKAVPAERLAGQLLLPMSLLGEGIFTTTDILQHIDANINIIRRFLDVDIKFTQNEQKCWPVAVLK